MRVNRRRVPAMNLLFFKMRGVVGGVEGITGLFCGMWEKEDEEQSKLYTLLASTYMY